MVCRILVLRPGIKHVPPAVEAWGVLINGPPGKSLLISKTSLFYLMGRHNSFACVMLSHFSHFQLFAAQWTVAHQAPLSMGFSRQEYWSGLPCLPPGDLPDPGIELTSPASSAVQADSLPLSHWGMKSALGGRY